MQTVVAGQLGEMRAATGVSGREAAKRAMDIAGALIGLALSAPVVLLAMAAIRVAMGPPALFRQQRVGRGERLFFVYKLRTMNQAREAGGELLPGPRRLTRLGRWLRYLSVDELPQFWNVLVGDMSLVGPRPLHALYLPYYTQRERTRHCVRPGLTGLAQVSGRNSLDWEARLELDAHYAECRSLGLDLRILWWTIGKVLRRCDVRDAALQGSLAEHRRHRAGMAPEQGQPER